MTLLNLPFQEKDVFERKHSFLHICHEMFLFCLCPVRSSLDSVLRPFFGVQNASFCVQKASLSVRAGRVRMKIHSAPFFESSSLKTRFSSKNAKILDQKQKRRKKRSLETQGIYIGVPTVVLLRNPKEFQHQFWWRITACLMEVGSLPHRETNTPAFGPSGPERRADAPHSKPDGLSA